MAVSTTPRLGVTRWTAGSDPKVTRAQLDGSHLALETVAAGFIERTLGTLPAPGAALDGFFCLITDVGPPGGRLYYCDATRWIEVGADYSLFGDGSDGDVTIVADSTLTRDMHYGQLTVNAGVRLDTGGFRIFARKSIVNNGVIHRDGTVGTGVGGTAKGAGTVGGGGAGGAATAAAYQLGGTGGASNNGSAAGFAAANPPEAEGGIGVFRFAPSAVFGRTVGGTVVGGGSGGRNNTAGTAGGGGGGGVVMVAAPSSSCRRPGRRSRPTCPAARPARMAGRSQRRPAALAASTWWSWREPPRVDRR
jgi:hypothetical protein